MKRTTRPKKTANRAPDADDPKFQPVIDALAGDRHVTRGRMFGSTGLKVSGKVFAMLVKGKFVAKLPRERVDRLVQAVGAQKGMKNAVIDDMVAMVDARLEVNRKRN